jgi:hypothetical protein
MLQEIKDFIEIWRLRNERESAENRNKANTS